jgi:hypothetical protein
MAMKRFLRIFLGGLLLAIVVPILLGAAVGYARGWPETWRDADWSSARILPEPQLEPDASVRILAARTGRWKGIFAVHTWIVMKEKNADAWVRYDVVGWGKPVRRDGYEADAFWYGNTPYTVTEIKGAAAERMILEIEGVIAEYPWRAAGSYTVWPGPNSNSFIAWLTRHVAGLETEMPPTAIGKDYLGPGLRIAKTPSGTGWQASAWGLFGASLALEEGIELHLLGTTIGIDPKSFALKFPAFGLVGLPLPSGHS